MEILEKDLEDFIFDDLTSNMGAECYDRGLSLINLAYPNKYHWFRQLNIDPYGICDIVGFYRLDGCVFVHLIELKKVPIIPEHLEQIYRYKKGLSVYLKNTLRLGSSFHIECHLIGSGYDGFYLQNYLPINIYEFTYDLTGIGFHKHKGHSTWHIPSGENKTFRRNGKKIY